jgi:hypothetical protein
LGNFKASNLGIGSRLGTCDAASATLAVGGTDSGAASTSLQCGLQCGSLVTESGLVNITALPDFANGEFVQGDLIELAGTVSTPTSYDGSADILPTHLF